MTEKERVLTAASLREPDRVPVIANLSAPVAAKLNARLGGGYETAPFRTLNTMISGRASYNELLVALGNSCIGVAAGLIVENAGTDENGNFVDEWGLGYCGANGYLEVVTRPLEHAKTPEDIAGYRLPDPQDPRRWDEAKRLIAKCGETHAVMGCMGQTMLETCWNLIGFEKFLLDLYTGEEYLLLLLEKLADYSIRYADELMALGCDIIFLGDDVGTQNGLLISEDLWRARLKPGLTRIFSHIHANSRCKAAYHSCGSIAAIIKDLIEIGVDILNPIQPLAAGMELESIKKKYGGCLCLYGGIDVQQCIPRGTLAEVREQVRLAIRTAASGGGYIIGPAHIVPSETEPENVLAFFDAVREFGCSR